MATEIKRIVESLLDAGMTSGFSQFGRDWLPQWGTSIFITSARHSADVTYRRDEESLGDAAGTEQRCHRTSWFGPEGTWTHTSQFHR